MTNRESMVYDLARGGLTRDETARVLRCLPAIQRAHEAACMAWPEEAIQSYEDRAERAFRRLSGILESAYSGTAVPRVLRQRDPRGCTVALYKMSDDPERAEPYLRLSAEGFTASMVESIDRHYAKVRS